MQKNKENFKRKNISKKKFNSNYKYFKQKNRNYFYKKNNIYYILGEKKPLRPLITAYLHRNKKIKTGFFFTKPKFKTILYPFYLNLKLINEYLKKK